MAGQRGAGLLLPLLLLSLDVLDLALETTTLLPTSDSTITATVPPFSSETFTPEVPMDARAATPRGRSPAASITPTPQAMGSPAHSTSGSPANTTVEPKLTPTGLGLTTGTPAPTFMAMTTNCAAETTIVTSVGTSTALSLSSSGVEINPLTAPTSASTPRPSVGTPLGTSTSPGPSSSSSPTAAAPTAASDEPSATPPNTVTNTEVPGRYPASSQPAETSPGAATPAAPETTAGECSSRAQAGRGRRHQEPGTERKCLQAPPTGLDPDPKTKEVALTVSSMLHP
ncbi:mucin-2-like [Dryobates pubescens]|uniref:mucin-2-like n=1 Tax=Dryobates pubescens TaxID=118200 RepID=UPI0023B93DA9|nr:mucin-2-like [Dryobates pubescens]